MSVTKKEVEHIANLARLRFDEKELENFTGQLNQIIAYIDKLNELDTDDVEPLSHPIEKTNVFRNDELKESVATSEALKNAPDCDEHFFKVPKVISNG